MANADADRVSLDLKCNLPAIAAPASFRIPNPASLFCTPLRPTNPSAKAGALAVDRPEPKLTADLKASQLPLAALAATSQSKPPMSGPVTPFRAANPWHRHRKPTERRARLQR